MAGAEVEDRRHRWPRLTWGGGCGGWVSRKEIKIWKVPLPNRGFSSAARFFYLNSGFKGTLAFISQTQHGIQTSGCEASPAPPPPHHTPYGRCPFSPGAAHEGCTPTYSMRRPGRAPSPRMGTRVPRTGEEEIPEENKRGKEGGRKKSVWVEGWDNGPKTKERKGKEKKKLRKGRKMHEEKNLKGERLGEGERKGT